MGFRLALAKRVLEKGRRRQGHWSQASLKNIPLAAALSLKSGLGCAVRCRLEGDAWDADTG